MTPDVSYANIIRRRQASVTNIKKKNKWGRTIKTSKKHTKYIHVIHT